MIVGILAGGTAFLLLYGRLSALPLAFLSVGLCICCALPAMPHGRRHHYGSIASIDNLARLSPLNRMHTGFKLCFSMSCAVICIAAGSAAVSLCLLVCMAALTLICGKVPVRRYLKLLSTPGLFILAGIAAILIEAGPVPLGLLDIPVFGGYLSVTETGRLRALTILHRTFGAVSCLYFLSLTTPVYRIAEALRAAHVPKLMVELMYLIYRYIFLLEETHEQMRIAAGARLGYRNRRTTLRSAAGIARNLMFIGFKRSSDCFAAMESRCYDGELRFLSKDDPVRAGHILAALSLIATLIFLWIFSAGGV